MDVIALEDLPLAYRIAIAIGAIVFTFLLLLLLPGASAQPRPPPPSKWDARMIEIDKQALDEAYKTQLLLLFSIWLKDGAGTDAARITNGLNIARRAYAQAATQLEAREQRQ